MATTAVGRPAGQLHSLPERDRAVGPVTAALFRRDAAILGTVWTAALAVVAGTGAGALHAFAHGLLVPGGGFLYTGDTLLFALSLSAFVVGFTLWFVLGMMAVPFAVWLGAAALAATRAGGTLREGTDAGLPLALLAVVAASLAVRSAAISRDRRRAVQHNRLLATIPYVPPRPRERAFTPAAELSERQLQFQRHILNLGLQPRDMFGGFEWVDQFREAAVRYQLNYAG